MRDVMSSCRHKARATSNNRNKSRKGAPDTCRMAVITTSDSVDYAINRVLNETYSSALSLFITACNGTGRHINETDTWNIISAKVAVCRSTVKTTELIKTEAAMRNIAFTAIKTESLPRISR